MSKFRVAFITAPTGAAGKKIAESIVKKRLAACVNVVPAVRSIYWWKGKIEKAGESLLIVKTTQARLAALIKHVKAVHPYTVPEIIALPITAGHKPYLDWLAKETR